MKKLQLSELCENESFRISRFDYNIDIPISIHGVLNCYFGLEYLDIGYNDNEYFYSLNPDIEIIQDWNNEDYEEITNILNKIGFNNIINIIQKEYNDRINEDEYDKSLYTKYGKEDIVKAMKKGTLEI